MDGLLAITALKIDISIKNRKKMKFNKKHQFKNPFEDNRDFTFPKNCLKQHTINGRTKLHCTELNVDDIADFRSRLYRSDEKRDQSDFLYDFITTQTCKNSKKAVSSRRMLSVQYFIQKLDGTLINVCKDMFELVTAFKGQRCRKIYNKRFKADVLFAGEEVTSHPSKRLAKMDEQLKARKEKLLNLEKGQLDTFTKAIKGIGDQEETTPKYELKKLPKKRYNKKKHLTVEEEIQQPDFSDPGGESFDADNSIEPEKPRKRINLNLNLLEVCRLCLQNSKDMVKIFRKVNFENFSPANLMEYCLGIELDPHDQLPKMICTNCYESVKIACNLKTDWVESVKIMQEVIGAAVDFEPLESEEVCETLYSYSFKEEADEGEEQDIIEDASMTEEFIVETIEEEPVFSNEEKFKEENPEEVEDVAIWGPTEPPKKVYGEGMRPRKCYLCDLGFETTAEDHFRDFHPLIKFDRCTKCMFESDYPWFLNLHMQVHLDDFKLCPHCGGKFQLDPEAFQYHRIKCRGFKKQIKKPYQCHYCSEIVLGRSRFLYHIRREHTFQKPYKCSECDQAFYENIHLKRHLIRHGIGAKFFCEKCGKLYLQKYLLLKHQKFCYRNVT